MSYLCRDCIVSVVCEKVCEGLTYGNHLMDFFLTNQHCPDCRSIEIHAPSYWGISTSTGSIICTGCRSIFYIDLRQRTMWRYSKCNEILISYNWGDHEIKLISDFVNHILKPLLVRYRGSPR
jgi:hypothetical protein